VLYGRSAIQTVKITAIVTFIAICCSFAASKAYAQAPTASITAVSGSATIARAGRSFPATNGAAVQVGDRIDTGTDGRLTLTLSDGSQMELTESSSLVLTENNLNPNGTRSSTKVNLLGGLVRSLVRFTAGTHLRHQLPKWCEPQRLSDLPRIH
jgi:hypothetical protein